MKNFFKYFFIILLCFLSLSTCFGAEPFSYVKNIDIEGSGFFLSKRIKKVMTTKEPRFFSFLNPFAKKIPFRRSLLRSDINKIKALYKSEGFFNADVYYNLEYKNKDRDVKIKLLINQGPSFRVSKIKVQLIPPNPLLEKILAKKTVIKKGYAFNTDSYVKTKETILNYLLDNGYPNAEVEGKVKVYTSLKTAEILFFVYPGPLKKLGKLNISGLNEIDKKYVLKEIAFRQGENYSYQKISKSQRNLLGMGLFDIVDFTLKDEKSEKKYSDIDLTLKESKRRSIKFGIGYGNEEKIRVSVLWRARYILGLPDSLTLSAKYSEINSYANLYYNRPLLKKNLFFDFNSGYEYEDMVSYANEKIVLKPQIRKEFLNFSNVFGYYSLEINRPVKEPSLDDPDFTEEEYYLISSLGGGFKFNTAENILYPVKGEYLYFLLEWANKYTGSELDYLKTQVDFRFYREVLTDRVIALRVSLGSIKPCR